MGARAFVCPKDGNPQFRRFRREHQLRSRIVANRHLMGGVVSAGVGAFHLQHRAFPAIEGHIKDGIAGRLRRFHGGKCRKAKDSAQMCRSRF